ncbi:MAG: replicative DNA helicase [Candidatus Spechtbacteria bacterium]|nr:replicative DNA helicase [Candidatus Spechtbacteria bacterium]
MPKDTQSDKLPPQSIEAEQSVLGCLMIDRDAIYKVSDALFADDFYRGTHRGIYSAMVGLYERREPIDIVSLSQRLKEENRLEEIGGHSYLAELINRVPTATHVVHYANIVRQKRVLRDLITAAYDIGQLGYREGDNIDELLDEAEKRIFQISQHSLSQTFVPFKQELESAFNRIDQLNNYDGTLRGMPTGFHDLDNILAGLQKSDLIILAARPSRGKSSLALDIARQAALQAKQPVGLFSLEMSKDQLVDRMLASQGSVDLWRIRTGKLSSQGEYNDFTKLQHALDTLSQAPIFIDDAASASMLQIRSMSRRLQAERGLGLIIVDYLQLIQPRNPSDPVVQQVTEISRSLKGLARELNVPVLALSQLSRAVEQRGGSPRLSDLRDSGCLAGDMLITRADTGERVYIKELVGQKDIPVFTLNQDHRIISTKIEKVFSNGVKEIFELKTKTGRTIKASSNHKFFTLHGWQRIDELEPGARIALPRALEIKKSSADLSRNELTLLPHLIGDGCILPRQPMHYTSADWENIQTVAQAAANLFGISPRIVRQKNWWHVYLPSPYRLTRGKYHPITLWYKKLGLERVRSYNKQIPVALFNASPEQICLFLHHLWATDGNISWKKIAGRKPTAAIYYATSSKQLAQDIQHLLLRIGIWSSLRKVSQHDYRSMYHIIIQSAPIQLKFLKTVGCAGERGKIIPKLISALRAISPNTNTDTIPNEIWDMLVEPEKEKIGISWRGVARGMNVAYNGSALFASGMSRERLTRVATVLSSNELRHFAESDIYWDEITSITPCGKEEVYDATIPGTHNFVANDFIVHNSIEQDADVVLFIHRDDKDQEDAERNNIADIIVAKHRNGPTGKIQLYFDDRVVSFKNLTSQASAPQEPVAMPSPTPKETSNEEISLEDFEI